MRVTLVCVGGGGGVIDERCDWEGRGDGVIKDNGAGGRRERVVGVGDWGRRLPTESPACFGPPLSPTAHQHQPDYLQGPRC